jgi:hypothetical protein
LQLTKSDCYDQEEVKQGIIKIVKEKAPNETDEEYDKVVKEIILKKRWFIYEES